ncbi:MAG: hypothetical protein ACF8MJ_05105 [Phycisphaerales bacterium JB050]
MQKVNDIVPGTGQSRPDWSVLDDIAARLGTNLGFGSGELDDEPHGADEPVDLREEFLRFGEALVAHHRRGERDGPDALPGRELSRAA